MSGLETAIRNALDRAERGDGQVRARIYQSARQALDAGLRKQGVTDNLVILQQRKRLEEKIREIEDEEIDRMARVAEPARSEQQIDPFLLDPVMRSDSPAASGRSEQPPEIEMPAAAPRAAVSPSSAGSSAIGGVTRSTSVEADRGAGPSVMPDEVPAAYRDAPVSTPLPEVPQADMPSGKAGRKAEKKKKAKAAAEAPARRSRRGRRKRSLLSRLITWIITLAVVAVGCYIFYQSGMVQSVIDDATRSASRLAGVQASGQGPSALSSRGGFTDEWADIFEPKDTSAFKAEAQAQAEIGTGSEGPALKITSSSPNEAGDVAITVPVDVLRQLAGKSATFAITIQSAGNQLSQFAVSCDFGSLGSCSRHRFTATQERQDALLKVDFSGTAAPNAPGRLLINTGMGGTGNSVFIYSIRALPGE
ncbi:hypothetical protein [Neorhizobium sp. NCHU2750]|uniref:hypothetical protein n=1 Tax=Neorhizobium sp. NCHU2750 TaxID=1825976 RepID=UPI000EB72806|nr:hypothetical protein NCHU2750_00920 [Neorhizobium sp. NCHU2750]